MTMDEMMNTTRNISKPSRINNFLLEVYLSLNF